ncbi:MAG: phosphoribosylformylglycinamidine synthase [Oscillospiraceae bacterium]|nr:phosphoribosylformylglycinamidine synthase [Oscillospiraceae bacterium]
MITRIYSEKKSGFNVEAKGLLHELQSNLGIINLTDLRIFVRYDIEGISPEEYKQAKYTIFSEPQVDNAYDEELPEIKSNYRFDAALLPGQYDQRADFAAQCLQMLTQKERPAVAAGKAFLLYGEITPEEFKRIKEYVINPVESHEVPPEKPETLVQKFADPEPTPVLNNFINHSAQELERLINEFGLAMDLNDVLFCQKYFIEEKRNPTLTEIRVLDTYWSDHCRHTTFLTELEHIEINSPVIKSVFDEYLTYKQADKPVTLMNIALAAMKRLKADGKLTALDESEEINACSIKTDVDINGKTEPWFVMFKNETHNHPTEIEPFGGAATCLGGAIRDPLSGRAYVYQAMRVTGSADPRESITDTPENKLPQRVITTKAAAGYSSYGNQIGLSTGLVSEIYHEGYKAKRMECGAVIAAVPAENVRRETPQAGDVIVLLGGGTGRDGCGGATGSSKAHNEDSLASCGAEVQKGNPPEERKIQRLFRKKEVSVLIKRCNDFGAGGVCVAIGELANGLDIDLSKVPKKYEGLTGTELAISESQERMAVVVEAKDAEKFIALAREENINAVTVAAVTGTNRLIMRHNEQIIVNLSREFLNTNGAKRKASAKIENPDVSAFFNPAQNCTLKERLSALDLCSQKGLVERFDSSIGANTILMPFGGKNQTTPIQAMAAKIPVLHGETNTSTLMAYSYNPYLSEISPFHGAVYAVLESAAKITAAGGDFKKIYLTFQEYFEQPVNNPLRWGKPLAALLGAYHAQMKFGLAAIGGKDSMSGSYADLDVPPALISFAACPADARVIISGEFKKANHKLFLLEIPCYDYLPDFEAAAKLYGEVHEQICSGKVYSAYALGAAGICEAVKMCFGNDIGIEFTTGLDLYKPRFGSLVLEAADDFDCSSARLIGKTTEKKAVNEFPLEELRQAWEAPLADIFPVFITEKPASHEKFSERNQKRPLIRTAKPRVLIPVFPGTNCEYDSARAFEKHGAAAEILIINNMSSADIEQSVQGLIKSINNSQIVMLPGGFSAGDEPDGSAKFIATAFRNPRVKEAIHNLLNQRDGLMLGICNGFQALIKLGLVPYGEIREPVDIIPTLTYNTIGRHISCMAQTEIVSVLSPWLMHHEAGERHIIPVSHGEGRFIAPVEMIEELSKNGQIATQYVEINPNGSISAVEGITSPDGRVFGKMGHSERFGVNVAKNIIGDKEQKIFQAGVDYFK